MTLFPLILRQTFTLTLRKCLATLTLYIIVAALLSIALSPETKAHAGPLICAGLLLVWAAAMPLLFERDAEDGTLEQYLLLPEKLERMVLAKLIGHWLALMLPMLLTSLLLLDAGQVMLLTLASMSIAALNAIAAVLMLGQRGWRWHTMLMQLSYIPILILMTTSRTGTMLMLILILAITLPLACRLCAMLIQKSQR